MGTPTIGAVIQIASNMWAPGITNRENDSDESWFALGALDPEQQGRAEAVAEMLRDSDQVQVVDDIRSAKWMKLVVNAAELVPSAIINAALNDAAREPEFLQVMRKGRRAEVDEVSGVVVRMLKAHGKDAPMNWKVVDMAFAIEAGRLDASPDIAGALVATFNQLQL